MAGSMKACSNPVLAMVVSSVFVMPKACLARVYSSVRVTADMRRLSVDSEIGTPVDT